MTEYIVAQAPSPVELQHLVESLLDRGYQLQGGLVVDEGVFYQAMAK